MDEQQVRALVRQAIARHMGPEAPVQIAAAAPRPALVRVGPPAVAEGAGAISDARFHLVRPAGEVECLIEPTVACTHCGYCQCYGH